MTARVFGLTIPLSILATPTSLSSKPSCPLWDQLQTRGYLSQMSASPSEADSEMHREPPLDNHAPEKFGKERPKGSNSCSESESLGVGFETKCAGNSAGFSRAQAPEEKFADCVAESI